jgi:hypothetical protein
VLRLDLIHIFRELPIQLCRKSRGSVIYRVTIPVPPVARNNRFHSIFVNTTGSKNAVIQLFLHLMKGKSQNPEHDFCVILMLLFNRFRQLSFFD